MKQEANASPVHAQLLEAAADWFIDFRLGDADAQARTAFFAWLRQSPEHIRAYLQIAELYNDSAALKDRLRLDIDKIVARALEESNVVSLQPRDALAVAAAPAKVESPVSAPAARAIPRFAMAAAASVMLLLASAAVWYNTSRSTTYDSPVGEQHIIVLADGSKVTLDARSRVRVQITREARDIELVSGQALFDVAHDPARPFVVRSGTVAVRAVGTRFDVLERSNETTITVIQGKVAVLPASTDAAGSSQVLLSAGEQLIVSAQAGIRRPVQANIESATSWTVQRLVFESTPLEQVIEDFNRHNPRQLILRDEDLGRLRVTGTFSSNQPDSFVRFLRSQPGVVVEDSGREIVIDRR